MSNLNAVTFETAQVNPDFPWVRDVPCEELAGKLNKVQLIDVRQPEEFTGELGHIPGARLVVLDTLPARLQELSTNQPIVFICRSGARSARAAAFAHEHGLKDVYNMKGGMIRWNALGLETESKG